MLRTSERGTFKRCRWKWWMEFEETLKPQTDVPPLRFGSLVHLALRDYYKPGLKRGPHPAKRFAYHYERELRAQESFGFKVTDLEGDDVWREAGTLGEAMLTNYVNRYGADDEWEVLVTEQAGRQLVTDPATGKPLFWYTFILDGIWRNRRTKKIVIVDHKTAKTINVQYLSLDSQATAYWSWGLDWIYERGILKPNQKLAGMLYNHLRKAMPDERPKDEKGYALNKDGTISKKQPAPYFVRTPIWRDLREREAARRQVLAEFWDMQNVRNSERIDGIGVGAYKNQGQFTCPGCWCFDFCELHEIGADWVEMRDLATKTWDPYEAHEVYTGETR